MKRGRLMLSWRVALAFTAVTPVPADLHLFTGEMD